MQLRAGSSLSTEHYYVTSLGKFPHPDASITNHLIWYRTRHDDGVPLWERLGPGADPGFVKGEGGGPWRARGARAYNGSLGAEPLVGVRKLKAFSLFSCKRAKSLVFKLKKTPVFGPWGRPRPGPPIPGSTSGMGPPPTTLKLLFKQGRICRVGLPLQEMVVLSRSY